ncbi:MAG: hypothetical protein MUF34_37995 [Polyangiaceae bacterium]|jgi:hypothetical protein|nr:hypothetical protein [Polyangiaceae bacterium]
MADRLTKAEREELDAKVLARVRAGAHPHDVEGPQDRFFQNKIEASVARLRRAGTIAYDHAARRYVEGVPGAKRSPAAKRKPACGCAETNATNRAKGWTEGYSCEVCRDEQAKRAPRAGKAATP